MARTRAIRERDRRIIRTHSHGETTLAMAKNRSVLSSRWLWLLILVAVLAGALWLAWGDSVRRTAEAGTAYGARVACSCRFVAGRSLSDCAKDKLEGMEFVMLSENTDSMTVTASVPLIASDTATYREGYGCILKEWDR